MTRQALLDLIAGGESSEIEFQRSPGRDFSRELCAFANGEGGTVLLGVSKSGEVVGAGDHNRTRAKVLTIARSADPPISVEVESVGKVMCVRVPSQKQKPYAIGWRAFVREGRRSRRLSNAEIKDLYYAVGRAHFDKEPCKSFSMQEHLKADVWERFTGLVKIPEAMQTILALRMLGLVDTEDRMTYAGAWLLADDIRQFTESAYVSCAAFEGTDEVGSLDRQVFHSSVPMIIEDVLAWVLRRIGVQFTIWNEGGEGRPELPEEALREAVANAVAHRDYRSRESVRVHVFRDRVEITSPGGLPEGMTEADLGTKSVPRNPLLYGMLARMGLVGEIGSGIRRMNSLYRESGLDEPGMEVSATQVRTIFKRPSAIHVEPSTIQDYERSDYERSDYERSDPDGDAEGAVTQDVGAGVAKARPHMDRAPQTYKNNTTSIQDWERKTTIQLRELVGVLDRDRSRAEILAGLGLRNRSNLVVNYLRPALAAGLVEMTIPDKPTSGKQKYRLTLLGHELRAALEDRRRGIDPSPLPSAYDPGASD